MAATTSGSSGIRCRSSPPLSGMGCTKGRCNTLPANWPGDIAGCNGLPTCPAQYSPVSSGLDSSGTAHGTRHIKYGQPGKAGPNTMVSRYWRLAILFGSGPLTGHSFRAAPSPTLIDVSLKDSMWISCEPGVELQPQLTNADPSSQPRSQSVTSRPATIPSCGERLRNIRATTHRPQ